MKQTVIRHLILAVSLLVIGLFLVQVLLGIFTRHGRYREVPEMVGLSLDEATELAARNGGLRIEVSDSLFVPIYDGGVVLEQNPKAGTEVKNGRRIFVTVNSYRQKMVEIPYVTGFSLRQAKNNLESVGLEIERLEYVEDIATNYILSQKFGGRTIEEGQKVEAEIGSGITLVVGRGEDEEKSRVAVPRVVGMTLYEAKSRLWDSGLNVGRITSDEGVNQLNERNARVYVQSPAQGVVTSLGSGVALSLSLDDERINRGVTSADEDARRRADEEAKARAEAEAAEAEAAAAEAPAADFEEEEFF
ncbi:MAG: PASTA domain-containing protein [Tidjanibacter sp.]|nr:PASTA domain-containing protein [Tidjanibacter sp.]MBR6813500.1 PASTA domain-containing protein [Tidjanibacter sp.]